jgi:ABC-type dipeptide/oligopeptide/nickel transport system ATPase component
LLDPPKNARPALDTITQSEILRLFAHLNRELNMGILYISHDLLSVAALCHRIAILNGGEFVEIGPSWQIFGAPRHPYTQKLVAALPTQLAAIWPFSAFLASRKINKLRVFNNPKYSDSSRLHHSCRRLGNSEGSIRLTGLVR